MKAVLTAPLYPVKDDIILIAITATIIMATPKALNLTISFIFFFFSGAIVFTPEIFTGFDPFTSVSPEYGVPQLPHTSASSSIGLPQFPQNLDICHYPLLINFIFEFTLFSYNHKYNNYKRYHRNT